MTRTPVKSSLIVSIGFDGTTLEIEFKGGNVYEYSGVPAEKVKSLMAAESVGKYFVANIKNLFPAKKIV